jgi:ribose transport system substrate-binding protein
VRGIPSSRWGSLACIAATGAAALLTQGCGSSSSSSSKGSTSDAAVQQAKAFVKTAATPPTAWPGPKDSPPAAKGKRIAVISCSQASNCSVDATAAVEAAKAIGWKATIFDGKGDPSLYNASLRNAANAGYDGIVDVSLPPKLVQSGLRYVKQRKIPVINAADVVSADPLVFGNVEHQWADQGDMLGKWLIADSDGKAGVVIFRDDEFPGVKTRQDHVATQLAKCGGCENLAEVKLTIAQATNPSSMAQQTQSAAARFGKKLTYIVAPFGTVDGLVISALKAKGRSDVKVVGYDGNAQQSQLCHAGSIGAVAVTMLAWTGWGAVDQLNRAISGKPAAEEKVPAFLATSQTCPPDGLAENLSTFDFRSEYKKLWGV